MNPESPLSIANEAFFAHLLMEKQLAERIGDAPWSVDMPGASITFETEPEPTQFDIQFLGTYSAANQSWMWGWNNVNGFPDRVIETVLAVREAGRERGVDVVTREVVELGEDITPNDLIVIAKALTKPAGSLLLPVGEGTVVALLLPSMDVQPISSLDLILVLSGALEQVPLTDHRAALRAIDGLGGLRIVQEGADADASLIEVETADGRVAIEFDPEDRIFRMETVTTEPEPEPNSQPTVEVPLEEEAAPESDSNEAAEPEEAPNPWALPTMWSAPRHAAVEAALKPAELEATPEFAPISLPPADADRDTAESTDALTEPVETAGEQSGAEYDSLFAVDSDGESQIERPAARRYEASGFGEAFEKAPDAGDDASETTRDVDAPHEPEHSGEVVLSNAGLTLETQTPSPAASDDAHTNGSKMNNDRAIPAPPPFSPEPQPSSNQFGQGSRSPIPPMPGSLGAPGQQPAGFPPAGQPGQPPMNHFSGAPGQSAPSNPGSGAPYNQPGGAPFGAGQGQPQSPFGTGQPQPPFGGPQPGTPFGAPQQPFGGNQPQQPQAPFGAPQPGAPYGSPQPGMPYGAPQQGSPFGAGQPASGFGQPQQSPYAGPQQGTPFGQQPFPGGPQQQGGQNRPKPEIPRPRPGQGASSGVIGPSTYPVSTSQFGAPQFPGSQNPGGGTPFGSNPGFGQPPQGGQNPWGQQPGGNAPFGAPGGSSPYNPQQPGYGQQQGWPGQPGQAGPGQPGPFGQNGPNGWPNQGR